MNRDKIADIPETNDIARDLERRVARAAEEGHRFAVIAVAPQQLPGEHMPELLHAMTSRLPEFVRATDFTAMLDGEALIVGAENDYVSAAVLADRLQSELRLRTLYLQNTAWESGIACLPDDGTTAGELLNRALAETQTRRRRLAAL